GAVKLGDGVAQLRLEAPLVGRPGDRFVLREISPPRTLGGGRVLDPAPRRHGPQSGAAARLLAIRERGLDAVMADEERQRAQAERRPAVAARTDTKGVEDRRPLDRRARLMLAVLEADGAEPRAPGAVAERIGIPQKEAVAALDRLVDRGL